MKTMKTTSKLALCALLAAGLHASIIFGTGVPGTTEGLSYIFNYNGTPVATDPAGAWHSPIGTSLWESILPDSTVVPNDTVADFWLAFNLTGTPTGGSMSVLVDDTAQVFLNSTLLADSWGSPAGPACGTRLPNCVTPDPIDIGAWLLPGANRVDVLVAQVWGDHYGLDVYGTADVAGTPEPGTWALLLSGGALLVLIGTLLARERRP